jgi:hypothetical protein
MRVVFCQAQLCRSGLAPDNANFRYKNTAIEAELKADHLQSEVMRL